MNLMLRNQQQIPRTQKIRAAFHHIGDMAGKAEHDFVKIMVVRLEVEVALIDGMEQPVFLVEIAPRADRLHDAS